MHYIARGERDLDQSVSDPDLTWSERATRRRHSIFALSLLPCYDFIISLHCRQIRYQLLRPFQIVDHFDKYKYITFVIHLHVIFI